MTTKILAFNITKSHFEPLTCDDDGKLLVSSSGGGTGGDASAANQVNSNLAVCTRLDNIDTELETQTDRLLYDLDIIANRLYEVQGSIEVTNQITGYATSQIQTDSNLAVCTRLTDLNQIQDDMLLSVDGINTKLSPIKSFQSKYNIEAATLLQSPGQNPSFTAPPSSLGIPASEGYYYKNSVLGASQLYYYSWLNLSAAPADQTKPFRLDSITNSFAVLRVGNVDTSASIPFIGLYTRPQGSGDYIPGFARSRRVYTLPTQSLTQGMKFMIWWGVEPNEKLFPGIVRIQANLTLSNGPLLGSELVAFMSVNSDSGAALNKVEYIIGGAGWQVSAPGLTEEYLLTFSGESSIIGDATAGNQVASNTAICTRLETSNLIMDTILGVLGDSVPVINYGMLNDSPQYIPIKASNTGNLCVIDTQTRDELFTLNETMNGLISGDSQMYVTLSGADDSISIMGFNTVLEMPQTITLTESGTTRSLDVNVTNTSLEVNNMITGFATETTLQDIKDQTDLLTFSSKDGLNALLVKVDNQLTTPFSVTETNPLTDYATETTSALIQTQTDKLAFSTTELDGNALNIRMYAHDVALDEIRAVRMGESSGLMVENAPGTSLAVTIADTVPISSGSPLDVHIYGSSDGTTWHHIKTNPNGVVATNAIMETDANGALTSTSITGTETYNALHVLTKGTTTVSGTVKSQAQDTNNTQVATNASVVGPMRIGNADADTQNYLWVSAIFSFTSVSSGGQVYLEVSHDGSIWARPSSASTFVMSSGASVTGAIILSTACPFRYARLWVDSGFNGSGCSAWIVMK